MNQTLLADLDTTIGEATAKVRECLTMGRPADAREYSDAVSALCYGRSCVEFEDE